jgi:hypothetical protein
LNRINPGRETLVFYIEPSKPSSKMNNNNIKSINLYKVMTCK